MVEPKLVDRLVEKSQIIAEAAAILAGEAKEMADEDVRDNIGTILHEANELDDLFPDPNEP